MILTIELTLLLAALLALGVWGLASGLRAGRRQRAAGVTPQQLSRLEQPYRRMLGEAVDIHRDVAERVREAPAPLQAELAELARRIGRLNERLYPRALHGTRLVGFLARLGPDEPQRAETAAAAARVEAEIGSFLATLKTLRGKVYQLLTDATALGADGQVGRDLHDALIDIEALEEAFRETRAGA